MDLQQYAIPMKRRNLWQRLCYAPKLFSKHFAVGKGEIAWETRWQIARYLTWEYVKGN